MSSNTVACFLLVSCLFSAVKGFGDDKRPIKQLFTLHRHGARSPVTPIPKDPYNAEWNRTGYGELTNVGKRQQLENGRMSRERYSRHYDSIYRPTEFFIQSTNFNRCVMSGQCFVTGLFTPRDYQKWSNELLGQTWQPIPVFTTNLANTDNLFLPLYQYFSQLDPAIYQKHKDVIDCIANAISIATGQPFNSAAAFSYIDALVCNLYDKATLPFGLKFRIEELIDVMDDILDSIVSRTYYVFASIILNDMVGRIQAFNNGTSVVRSNVYSMSDIHVASMMAALSKLVGQPEFCATLHLEIYGPDHEMNTDYVTLWYRSKLYGELNAYTIRDCGKKCPIAKFLALVAAVNQMNT